MAKFEVRVTGSVPQQFSIEADSKDDAENEALNLVVEQLDITIEAENPKPFLVRSQKKCRSA